MLVPIDCPQCGRIVMKERGGVNRSRRKGAPVYCGRTCAGEARSLNRSDAEKKQIKRLYDIEYRAKNREKLKASKAEYHKKTYDPDKARVVRGKRATQHAEYCRRPEYKKWKREYDREYRAKRDYGEFWESALLVLAITDETLSQASRYEIMYRKGVFAKTQKRRREYEKAYRRKPKGSPLGYPEQAPIGQLGSIRR